MSELKVWDNGDELIIAESAAEAHRLWCEQATSEPDDVKWKPWEDDAELELTDEDAQSAARGSSRRGVGDGR